MSRLLDPMHRRHIEALGIGPGARAVEVGCGNGSISAWLAERVGPGGRVVAVDLDLSLIDVTAPNLEPRQADICAGPVEPGGFDLVTARAVLHHVADAEAAIRNLAASLAPGGGDPADRARLPPGQRRRAARGAGLLGRLARLVARRRASTTISAARSPRGSPPWASSRSPARPRPPSTMAARPGPPTGSTRSPSSAPASWPRATSTTGSSTASSPSAPTRTGGPRRLRSRPSTPALPAAGERRVPPKRPDSPLPGGRCYRRSLSLTPRSPSSLLPPAIISSKASFFEVSTRPAPLRRRGCTANLASSARLDVRHAARLTTAVPPRRQSRRGQPGITGGR